MLENTRTRSVYNDLGYRYVRNARTRSGDNDLGYHYVRKYPYTLSIHALELFNVTHLDIIYES